MLRYHICYRPGFLQLVLRHAAGFKLANDGVDTRSLQAYLGHKSISNTVRYTELSHHAMAIQNGNTSARPKAMPRYRAGGAGLIGK